MKSKMNLPHTWKMASLLVLLCGLANSASSISFDIPDAFGIAPNGINPAGAVVGLYYDAKLASQEFLRARDGTFTNIDPSGSAATFPAVIGPAGVITGIFFDSGGGIHGFLFQPYSVHHGFLKIPT